jgi:hypothetical protein
MTDSTRESASLLARDGRIRAVPSVHGQLAFALAVREAFFVRNPDVIALELPWFIKSEFIEGVEALPRMHVVWYEEEDEDGEPIRVVIPLDICDAMIEAARLALDYGIRLELIDAGVSGVEERRIDFPDCAAIRDIGLETLYESAVRTGALPPSTPGDQAREKHMARRLETLLKHGERILWVGGMAHWEGIRSALESAEHSLQKERIPESVGLSPVSPASFQRLMGEMPALASLYEELRHGVRAPEDFDYFAALKEILVEAERSYEGEMKERVDLTRYRGMMQFARNLALTRSRIVPDLSDIVQAARGTVNDDYGWHVMKTACENHDAVDDSADSDERFELQWGGYGLFADGRHRVRRQGLMQDTVPKSFNFRRRPTPEELESWQREMEQFDERTLCSWPPEDIFQERFMAYVRDRAIRALGEERSRSEEFQGSLKDGLDLKETLRNWHVERKLFVKNSPPIRGKVGPVVLVFERGPEVAEKYTFRMSWWAENQNESDVAFYATPYADNMIGPGIGRSEFGGVVYVYPAVGIFNIWDHPLLMHFTREEEVLLLAAIIHGRHRYIAYVADSPPPSRMRMLAARNGHQIIYLPLSMFGTEVIRRFRRVHILKDKQTRHIGREFIL